MAKAPTTPKAPEKPKQVELRKLEIKKMMVVVIGDTQLIVHAWSKKAIQMMLDKQMKKATGAKQAKDPEQDYTDSLYHLPGDKYGFPSIGFKAAAIDACSHIDGLTKVVARGAFHINQEFIEIHGTPQRRQDMVRIAMETADIRFRGEFPTWHAFIPIRYNANVLSEEQIYNLFNTAGFAIGVGEWRPQRDGQYGLFHVANEEEIRALGVLKKSKAA